MIATCFPFYIGNKPDHQNLLCSLPWTSGRCWLAVLLDCIADFALLHLELNWLHVFTRNICYRFPFSLQICGLPPRALYSAQVILKRLALTGQGKRFVLLRLLFQPYLIFRLIFRRYITCYKETCILSIFIHLCFASTLFKILKFLHPNSAILELCLKATKNYFCSWLCENFMIW